MTTRVYIWILKINKICVRKEEKLESELSKGELFTNLGVLQHVVQFKRRMFGGEQLPPLKKVLDGVTSDIVEI